MGPVSSVRERLRLQAAAVGAVGAAGAAGAVEAVEAVEAVGPAAVAGEVEQQGGGREERRKQHQGLQSVGADGGCCCRLSTQRGACAAQKRAKRGRKTSRCNPRWRKEVKMGAWVTLVGRTWQDGCRHLKGWLGGMKKRKQEERGEPNKKMRQCVVADVCVGGMEKEKAENSRGRRRECKQLSIEAVEMYVKYRSFDVIGCGGYRKYVNARKEAGEAWAGKMLRCVGEVTAAVRTVHGLVEDLQAAYNQSGLYQVCQAVIENNTPPVDQTTVIGQCVVSKKEKCNCILLRCKGRGAVSLSVQSRFSHFILMLWTVYKVGLPCLMCACKCLRSLIPFVCLPSFFFGVCKTTMQMDLVIKTATRDFVDNLESDCDVCMKDLCTQFVAANEKLPRAILHAIRHVTNSLYEVICCCCAAAFFFEMCTCLLGWHSGCTGRVVCVA